MSSTGHVCLFFLLLLLLFLPLLVVVVLDATMLPIPGVPRRRVARPDERPGRPAVDSNWRHRSQFKEGLTMEERLEFLLGHNRIRSGVLAGASNMRKMYWSSEVEAYAQVWANGCHFALGHPNLTSSKFMNTMGQNIFVGTKNVTAIVEMWASTGKRYLYNNLTCLSEDDNRICFLYTQMVWSQTYIIGCGMSYCPNMASYMTVCDYYPQGNVIASRPYLPGRACTDCPAEAMNCLDGLCASEDCSTIENACTVIQREYCLCAQKDYSLPSVLMFAAARDFGRPDRALILSWMVSCSLLWRG